MQEVINLLEEDIITLGLMVGCLGVLEILNILLGSIMALTGNQWNWKTFGKGILKSLLVTIIMAIYCIILEVLPFIFERANIVLPNDLVTYAQVLAIIVVALKKYIKGIYDKLLVLLDVTEEDINEEVGVG